MKKILSLFLVSIITFTQISTADVWAERQALSNIKYQVAAIEILVNSAMHDSNNSNSRTKFEYQVLLNDLRKIQSGISHHLTAPMEPVVPSTIDALEAVYTEHQK